MANRGREGAAAAETAGRTLEFEIHIRPGNRGRRRLREGARKKPAAPPGPARIPRVARLMALAIRFDSLIRRGAIKDYAELARLGGVTRARISQIMDLLNLAPDIQEELLFLQPQVGRETITERRLRSLAGLTDWEEQREKCTSCQHGDLGSLTVDLNNS